MFLAGAWGLCVAFGAFFSSSGKNGSGAGPGYGGVVIWGRVARGVSRVKICVRVIGASAVSVASAFRSGDVLVGLLAEVRTKRCIEQLAACFLQPF